MNRRNTFTAILAVIFAPLIKAKAEEKPKLVIPADVEAEIIKHLQEGHCITGFTWEAPRAPGGPYRGGSRSFIGADEEWKVV